MSRPSGTPMADSPPVIRTISDLRSVVAGWRRGGEHIALVPTMGALHAGHLSLVQAARKLASRVTVSIFVNPAQFGPNEDFASYPRDEARDLAMLEEAGVELVFLPAVEEMYPLGAETYVDPGPIAGRLEGAFRPGHFRGVATVVLKLFNI